MTTSKPVGELKKIVSLIDRSDFDNYVYPGNSEKTKFRPENKTYFNFSQEVATWTFQGSPNWGQRITFEVPWPWQGDFLNWIALRLKPMSWLPGNTAERIGPNVGNMVPLDTANFWIWAQSLGTIAIEKAEMEVDGIIIESFSGDWINVWNKTMHGSTEGIAYDDGIYNSYLIPGTNNILASEDGYIYCYLPFWFAKHSQAAFPLVSTRGPDTVRFHITLRPFSQVIRKVSAAMTCNEVPNGTSFEVRDYTFPFRKFSDIFIRYANPGFESADILCGISNVETKLRTKFVNEVYELMMEPVVESVFAEPTKYITNTAPGNTIKIQLPITTANGPIRQILFFIRRNANIQQFNDWNNYSALTETEIDPVWNPIRPLLTHAQLMVGTAVWADQPEKWWRATCNISLPGGIRAYGNYIYGYNFAHNPVEFGPTGTLNGDRVDIRLNLTVAPPGGSADREWSVSVFVVGVNWMRFQNSIANLLFME
jgi:hypothetical protein